MTDITILIEAYGKRCYGDDRALASHHTAITNPTVAINHKSSAGTVLLQNQADNQFSPLIPTETNPTGDQWGMGQ
jgi:hypothetical protein